MKRYFLIALLICAGLANSQTETTPFLTTGVDKVSENIGGNAEFNRFLDYHLNYPEIAMKRGKEGTVVIKYICSENGVILKAEIVEKVSPEIDAEAVRLFRLLQWSPALKDQQAVAFENTISIPFNIKKYKKSLGLRGKTKINKNNLPVDTSFAIYDKVSRAAEYVKGDDGLLEYIGEELDYPQEAKAKSIEGTVVIGFIIEKDGFVSNLNVLKELGGGCQEEALRIIGQTKWHPAIKDGMLVRTKMKYSIVFKLNNEFRNNSQSGQNVGGQY